MSSFLKHRAQAAASLDVASISEEVWQKLISGLLYRCKNLLAEHKARNMLKAPQCLCFSPWRKGRLALELSGMLPDCPLVMEGWPLLCCSFILMLQDVANTETEIIIRVSLPDQLSPGLPTGDILFLVMPCATVVSLHFLIVVFNFFMVYPTSWKFFVTLFWLIPFLNLLYKLFVSLFFFFSSWMLWCQEEMSGKSHKNSWTWF